MYDSLLLGLAQAADTSPEQLAQAMQAAIDDQAVISKATLEAISLHPSYDETARKLANKLWEENTKPGDYTRVPPKQAVKGNYAQDPQERAATHRILRAAAAKNTQELLTCLAEALTHGLVLLNDTLLEAAGADDGTGEVAEAAIAVAGNVQRIREEYYRGPWEEDPRPALAVAAIRSQANYPADVAAHLIRSLNEHYNRNNSANLISELSSSKQQAIPVPARTEALVNLVDCVGWEAKNDCIKILAEHECEQAALYLLDQYPLDNVDREQAVLRAGTANTYGYGRNLEAVILAGELAARAWPLETTTIERMPGLLLLTAHGSFASSYLATQLTTSRHWQILANLATRLPNEPISQIVAATLGTTRDISMNKAETHPKQAGRKQTR